MTQETFPGARSFLRLTLAEGLALIAEVDPSSPTYQSTGRTEAEDYAERNAAVYTCIGLALQLGYPAGVQFQTLAAHGERFPAVAYIDLPSGQVSWHLPAYAGTYDGHTNGDKAARIRVFVKRHEIDAL
jgi:hypothetical protein